MSVVYFFENPFSHGLSKVKNTRKLFGFINAERQEIIPCQYASATDFYKGVSIVSKKVKDEIKFGLINTTGAEELKCEYEEMYFGQYDTIFVTKKGKKGVFCHWKSKGIAPQYDQIDELGNDLLLVSKFNAEQTALASQAIYPYKNLLNAEPLHKPKNFIAFWTWEKFILAQTKKQKYAVLDLQANILLPDEYDYINPMKSEKLRENQAENIDTEYLFVVMKQNKQKKELFGVVNAQNQIILDCEYAEISTEICKNQYFFIRDKEGLCGVVDRHKKQIIPCFYHELLSAFPKKDTFFITEYGNAFIINIQNEVISDLYTQIQVLTDELVVIETHSGDKMLFNPQKMDFYSKENFYEVLLAPDVVNFYQKKPLVSQMLENEEGYEQENYGVFDCEAEKLVVPCLYQSIQNTANPEIFIAQKHHQEGGEMGIIDTKGSVLVPFMYDDIQTNDILTKYNKLCFLVEIEGKYGIIDQQNNILFDFQPYYLSELGYNADTKNLSFSLNRNVWADTHGEIFVNFPTPENADGSENTDKNNEIAFEDAKYNFEENAPNINPQNPDLQNNPYPSIDTANWERIAQTLPENEYEKISYKHKTKNITLSHPKNPYQDFVFITENKAGYYDEEEYCFKIIHTETGEFIPTADTICGFANANPQSVRWGFWNGLCVVYISCNAQQYANIIDRRGDYFLNPTAFDDVIELGENVYQLTQNQKHGLYHFEGGELACLTSINIDEIDYSPFGIITTKYRGRQRTKEIEIRRIEGKGLLWGTSIKNDIKAYQKNKHGFIFGQPHWQTGKEQFGFMSWEADFILNSVYDDVVFDEQGDWICACLKRKWGIFNAQGQPILPCEYDQITLVDKGIFECLKVEKQVVLVK